MNQPLTKLTPLRHPSPADVRSYSLPFCPHIFGPALPILLEVAILSSKMQIISK